MRNLLNKLRNFLNFHMRHPWVKYGKNVHFQWDVELKSPNKHVIIGDNVGINRRCVIITDIEIGNHVLIAPHCALLNRGEHSYNMIGETIFTAPRSRSEKIIIGDDVWIGFGSIILGGLTIGEGAVIAAGSLVLNNVPPYSVVAGSPAKVIKQRFNYEEIVRHKEMVRQKHYEQT